ncbi:hypothetical protein GS982_32060 [Rhodococcus hoagii]|nr:hypothetical protein [Prescottella equi]
MRMYHTDTGIAIETKDEITLNQHIDNAAAAIAIKLERRKRDPNYLLTESSPTPLPAAWPSRPSPNSSSAPRRLGW